MFHFYSKLVLCIFSFSMLSACVKIQDKDIDQAPDVNPVVTSSNLNTDEVESMQLLSQGEANDYQVKIKFPARAQAVQRFLKSEPTKSLVSLPLFVEDGVFIDEKPPLGAIVLYQFGRFESGNFIVLEEREVSVPIDLNIEKNISLDADTNWLKFKKIYVSEGITIYTNGFNFQITADQFIAPQLTVRTFAGESAAAQQQKGHDGGNILLKLKSGTGSVSFKMHGQKGGKGAKGQDTKADIVLSCGSKLVPGVCGPPSNEPPTVSRSLFPIPLEGRIGGEGMPGGHSGSVGISISEAHNLLFTYELEPGLGGDGGDGGAGQIVARDQGQIQGMQGPQGPRGVLGIYGSFCVKDQNSNLCQSR